MHCNLQECNIRGTDLQLQILTSTLDGHQGDSLSAILFKLTLQKVIQSIKMVPRGIKIGKEQLNKLAYADDIVEIGKNEIEIGQFLVEMEIIARKL